jgi:hypothetical protein
MSRITIISAAILLLLSAAVARPASAHHEAWILRDSGVQCAFNTPLSGGYDNYYDGLYNGATYSRWMSCPVSLSARWGSSSPSYGTSLWGRASAAAIYVVNQKPGTAFSCQAQARVASGGLRYSRVVSTTAGGDQRLMPNFASDWGGTFEAAKGERLTSLEFACQVPANYSGVYGYKVRMCIRNSACVPNGDFGESGASLAPPALTDSVQTSGIACMSSDDINLVRSELGAKNVGTNYVSVFCPITPPADDTNEVGSRKAHQVRVYYRGKTRLPGENPLICQLHARTRNWASPHNFVTTKLVSPAFVKQDGENVALNDFFVGKGADGISRADIALSVHCDLPPGYTIQGITSRIAIPAVAGGF